MARLATLTPAQKKDIRDGKTVNVVTNDGATIIVTPWLMEYAKAQYAAGQPIKILAEIPGNGMDLITIS
jgi:hypothetical protein